MKIPETIYIGAIPIKIEQVASDDLPTLMGASYGSKQLIKLDKALSKERLEIVFLHEIIHTILSLNSYYDENTDEKLIDALAISLHQIFQQIET